MARIINSPGVQITETDLSVTQQFGGGTNVFVAGFASQGPTDEVLRITSVSELEQVYGVPQTPAERYFYHSSKEVLNSSANLLVSRLPYGPGTGEGFSSQYGALFYPVVSTAGGFQIGQPTVKSLSQTDYDNIIQNNFTWGDITSGSQVGQVTTFVANSSVTTTSQNSAAVLAQILNVDPTPESYSIIYNSVSSVTFAFQVTLSTTTFGSEVAQFDGSVATAGIIILNSAQTTINEKFEGYYVALADNTGYGANTDFNAVNTIYSLSGFEAPYVIPTTRLGFQLSATKEQVGSDSISEALEFVPTYNFNDLYYRDSLVLGVFKIRNSIYEPQTLTYSLIESYIGSLDAEKKTVASIGGTPKSFYLEDVANESSANIKVLVNPKISRQTKWTSLSSTNIPDKSVTNVSRTIFPVGTFTPTYQAATNKQIGETVLKLERVLTHIETPETVTVDIIADAGLSTIHAMTSGDAFRDDVQVAEADLTNASSNIVTRWRAIFNTYNTFVQNTRKDCMYIADTLRPNFVKGENTKKLSIRSNTFSQNIYQPLRVQFEGVNTNYAAVYGNWVRVYDSFADKGVWAPSSGFVAAVYARSDAATQPWFAPAGFTRGTINNIIDIAFNPNQKQRDFLYTISVNPIALFSGDGFVVYGQKTLQSKPSAFDRVNVRRLFLTLERAVQRTLKYYVFEPNTEFTRTRVRSNISPIFDLARNTQGLFDYLIVCDERNNTSEVVDRNELAVDIYIKPTRAAEFILVNFIATRTNQNFLEII